MLGGREAISGEITNAFTSRNNADTLMNTLALDARLLRGAAPIDDEIPPNSAIGLTATAIYAGVRLAWDLPPAEDIVRHAEIEVTPDGEDTFTQDFASDSEATIFGLDPVLHTFRVKLYDEWDRASAWSAPVTATPISTAETDIDLAYKQAQGTLQGLIEAINLAGPSAEQGIQGVALAATYANNMLPLIESDMEMWSNSTLWPPAVAVDAQGDPIISSDEPAGHILTMARREGHWKLKHERLTPSTNYVWPVTQWREERRTTGTDFYILQATVSGLAGTQVSIAAEIASDATGTGLVTANENIVTLSGGTQKIYVGFTANAAKPYVRLRLGLHTDSTTVYWYKFMLEHARTGATEPSPWNAGILAVGSVAAHTLTAITANIAEAVIAEAAIQDAMIANLKVDKLIAGELDVGVDITAGGKISAAGATMDENGMYLKSQERNPEGNGGANSFPSGASIGDFLTSNPASGRDPKPHSGIGFFDDSNDPRRGILMNSRGESGTNKDGYISIVATGGGVDLGAETSAWVILRAAKPGKTGTVVIGQHLHVSGTITMPNKSIKSDDIDGLAVGKLNGGGTGQNIGPELIPEISKLRGSLTYGAIKNTPDLSKFVTGQELGKKGYVDAAAVRRIVQDMVNDNALRGK